MKRISFIIMLLAAASLSTVGCEKSKGCEDYSPWPSAEALEAWKEYSPTLFDSLEAYNDVVTTLNYFGREPSYCHDSIVEMRNNDSVLLCGYLKLWKPSAYLVTDDFHDNPIDTKRDSYITVYIDNHHEPLDTLRKAYFPALFRSHLIGEEYDVDYCCSYSYSFYLDTKHSLIRYGD